MQANLDRAALPLRPVFLPHESVWRLATGIPTSDNISLAVGDGARRMTYAELAAVWGTSQASAQRLVRRKHWPRQVGNDGVVRVLVPLDLSLIHI